MSLKNETFGNSVSFLKKLFSTYLFHLWLCGSSQLCRPFCCGQWDCASLRFSGVFLIVTPSLLQSKTPALVAPRV